MLVYFIKLFFKNSCHLANSWTPRFNYLYVFFFCTMWRNVLNCYCQDHVSPSLISYSRNFYWIYFLRSDELSLLNSMPHFFVWLLLKCKKEEDVSVVTEPFNAFIRGERALQCITRLRDETFCNERSFLNSRQDSIFYICKAFER